MENTLPGKKILHRVYFASTLFTIHYSLIAFINSSFLARFVSIETVGLAFIVGAIVTLIFLGIMPKLLKSFGNFSLTVGGILTSIISLVGLATATSALPALIFFVLHTALVSTVSLNLDIFTEEFSSHDAVGGIRGMFLALGNGAYIVAQLIIAAVLTDGDYWKIYIIAIACALMALVYVSRNLRRLPDISYTPIPWHSGIKTAWARWNVRHILLSNLVIQLFFAWSTIYVPIYLHTALGFDWGAIGIMFTIMLIPYLLFEVPLGRIADSRFGEKEILLAGFIIIALSTFLMAFLTSHSILPWILILFSSRVGASAIEVMNETYFFKKVRAEDTTTIELFRATKPTGYILAPAIAGLFLPLVGMQYLFLVLGTLTLIGIYTASRIIDTN